jgi:hypothetical protein
MLWGILPCDFTCAVVVIALNKLSPKKFSGSWPIFYLSGLHDLCSLHQVIGASSYTSSVSMPLGPQDSSQRGSFDWYKEITEHASSMGDCPGAASNSGASMLSSLATGQQRPQQPSPRRASISSQANQMYPLMGPGATIYAGGGSAGNSAVGSGGPNGLLNQSSLSPLRRQTSNLSMTSRQGSTSFRPSSPLSAGPSSSFLAVGSRSPTGLRSRGGSFIGPGGMIGGGQLANSTSGSAVPSKPVELQPVSPESAGWKNTDCSTSQASEQPANLFGGLDVLGRPMPEGNSMSAALSAAAVGGPSSNPAATATGTTTLRGLLSPHGGSSKGLKVKFSVEQKAPVRRTKSYQELYQTPQSQAQQAQQPQQPQQQLQVQPVQMVGLKIPSNPKRAAARTYSKTRLCAGVSWTDLSQDGLIKAGSLGPSL